MLRILHGQTLSAHRCRNHCLAHCHRLENFEPRAAPNAQRNNTSRAARQEGANVLYPAGEPHRLFGLEQRLQFAGRVSAHDFERHRWMLLFDQGKDSFHKVKYRVLVWKPIHRASEDKRIRDLCPGKGLEVVDIYASGNDAYFSRVEESCKRVTISVRNGENPVGKAEISFFRSCRLSPLPPRDGFPEGICRNFIVTPPDNRLYVVGEHHLRGSRFPWTNACWRTEIANDNIIRFVLEQGA